MKVSASTRFASRDLRDLRLRAPYGNPFGHHVLIAGPQFPGEGDSELTKSIIRNEAACSETH